ncbi:hypothetical protein HK102_003232 [Quaeritorhiza haematococci]|nr:hypothetical protein HK102_003232 [Quaeritorhiza haematococci]
MPGPAVYPVTFAISTDAAAVGITGDFRSIVLNGTFNNITNLFPVSCRIFANAAKLPTMKKKRQANAHSMAREVFVEVEIGGEAGEENSEWRTDETALEEKAMEGFREVVDLDYGGGVENVDAICQLETCDFR